ncbi:MAG TPA: nuclease-related domain-containing protein [Acidimicrobiales bacterium]|nr:nuclease-related domain-containing protein [Acidimicrobiales bacterium]
MIPAQTRAWWDAAEKSVTCLTCWESTADSRVRPTAAPPAPTAGAGSSAQREYERRRQRREDDVRAKHPHVGGLLLAVTDEPQSTTAWRQGAAGERKLAAALDEVPGVRTLHDRRRPGTRANIDHIAICPSGVFVIDTKRYTKGQIRARDVGGWFKRDVRLYVGSRDCSKFVGAMAKQVDAVQSALGDLAPSVPVVPVLCFVDGDWSLFTKPFTIDGVWITWGKALRKRLTHPGQLGSRYINAAATALEEGLPPA